MNAASIAWMMLAWLSTSVPSQSKTMSLFMGACSSTRLGPAAAAPFAASFLTPGLGGCSRSAGLHLGVLVRIEGLDRSVPGGAVKTEMREAFGEMACRIGHPLPHPALWLIDAVAAGVAGHLAAGYARAGRLRPPVFL